MKWWNPWTWKRATPAAVEAEPVKPTNYRRAANKARELISQKLYRYPIQKPELDPRVTPNGSSPAVAMDDGSYAYAASYAAVYGASVGMAGFPGYPYLASLATRAEYRAFASTLATEITREWLVLNSTDTAADVTKERIAQLEQKIEEIGLKDCIRRAAEQDALFGRAQIYIELSKNSDPRVPLILDKRTVPLGSFKRICNIEPMWTTPVNYNALTPWAPDFYKPTVWFVLGKQVHASRLPTIITREVPDMLKPAFNFGGMSLSQLAEPYVDNWLRTRQSVSDLIDNFSTTVVMTQMDQLLQVGAFADGGGQGDSLFERMDFFTAMRNNRGVMVLDKDKESLEQANVPLSGLHELQAQSQEQMCSVSKMPAIVLTGISPGGLNASSDSEIRVWYDWVAALQEAYYRAPIQQILEVLMLSMFGEIDPDIGFAFEPLYQMTAKELSEIRLNNAQAAGALIDRQVLAPEEERERLARDPASGYQGLEVDDMPEQLETETEDEEDLD